jgi:hypothetical protein
MLRFKVVGECPVVVGGQEWRPQSLITVDVPTEAAAFLQRIGAIAPVPEPLVDVPPVEEQE